MTNLRNIYLRHCNSTPLLPVTFVHGSDLNETRVNDSVHLSLSLPSPPPHLPTSLSPPLSLPLSLSLVVRQGGESAHRKLRLAQNLWDGKIDVVEAAICYKDHVQPSLVSNPGGSISNTYTTAKDGVCRPFPFLPPSLPNSPCLGLLRS